MGTPFYHGASFAVGLAREVLGREVMFKRKTSLALFACMMVMLAAWATAAPPEHAAPAELGKLGTVVFPTSGPPEAQAHFLRGVAALHSFWYDVARDEFRASTHIAPDFMMGYWGEAM